MARVLEELLTPRAFDLTTFPDNEGYQQLVIERVSSSGRCASILPAIRRPRLRRVPAPATVRVHLSRAVTTLPPGPAGV